MANKVASRFKGLKNRRLTIDASIASRAPNKESFCRLPPDFIITPELVLFDLKNPRLQHIFNEEKDDLETKFADLKKVVDAKTFKHEVLLSFWLCIYLKRFESI